MRRAHLALALVLLAWLAGCNGRGTGAPAASDGLPRLSALLRQGAQAGELTLKERFEVESLLRKVLPPLRGDLVGYHWRMAYDDLPEADFVNVDLLEGPGDLAPRAMWFHVFWRGPLASGEHEAYDLRLGRWPARGVEGHHLFVRVGGIELRAVAEAPAYRDPRRLRGLLQRFDLEALARL